MCHLCSSISPARPVLSRRQFLQGAAAASLTALLAACGSPSETTVTSDSTTIAAVATPTLAPTRQEQGITPAYPAEQPALAGSLSALSEGAITLAAPAGSRSLAVQPQLQIGNFSVGQSVAVWLDSAQQVTAIQPLPPLAATDDIPGEPEQPAANGERQLFGPLEIISRAGWGAAPSPHWVIQGESGLFDPVTNPGGWLVYSKPLSDWFTTLVVHHSALEFSQGPQTIQRLHIGRKGFADVGYHFLIDGLGQLYEGRPLNVRGAHTGGYNTGTIGICLLGNFEIVRPVTAQLNTLGIVARYLQQEYTITHLAGHRDFQPDATVCPGATLHPLLAALAQESGLLWGTEGYRS